MSDAKDKVLAAIGAAADKTKAARVRRASKRGAGAYAAVWEDAVLDAYGKENRVALLIKEQGMLKRALDRLEASDGERKAFITWVVGSWATTFPTLWPKVTGMGDIPNVGWFVGNVGKFWNAYCRRGKAQVSSGPSQEQSKRIAELEQQVARLTKELRDAHSTIKRLKLRKTAAWD